MDGDTGAIMRAQEKSGFFGWDTSINSNQNRILVAGSKINAGGFKEPAWAFLNWNLGEMALFQASYYSADVEAVQSSFTENNEFFMMFSGG